MCKGTGPALPRSPALVAHCTAAGAQPAYKVLRRCELVPPAQRFAAIQKGSPEPTALPMPPASWLTASG